MPEGYVYAGTLKKSVFYLFIINQIEVDFIYSFADAVFTGPT